MKNQNQTLILKASFFIIASLISSNFFSQHCTPTTSPSSSYGILKVALNYTLNTSSANEGYVDRSSIYDSLIQGNSYSLSLSLTNPNAQGTIFIDWNQDMIFDSALSSTEKYVRGFSMGTPFTINVPASNPLGNIRMRLMVKGPGGGNIQEPCGTNATEVEDYTLVITPGITTEINEIETKKASIIYGYPNPSKELLNFSFDNSSLSADNIELQIYNASGQIVDNQYFKISYGKNQLAYKTKHLPSGLYNFVFHNNNLNETLRILIQH